MRVEKYEPGSKQRWDDLVSRSRNGTFLFFRDYMEYHSDRFDDCSLLIFAGERLRAILPASIADGVLVSHGGLTYGGVVCSTDITTPTMLEIFSVLHGSLRSFGIKKLVYKTVPHIYHRGPAQHDLYALFRHGATLVRRDVSSTIAMADRIPYARGRNWSINRARRSGLQVSGSQDYQTFMSIVEDNLRDRYGVKPAHTAQEIQLLADRFPENIKLFAATKDDCMLAGVVVYESARVAHAQYIAATQEGKELGASDFVLDFLITEHYTHKRYFDFGISTENAGRYLNMGLIRSKEKHGSGATVYDTYEWNIAP